ncbi:peroxiredoxin, partial [Planktothrix sp. FACHB-1355]
TSGCTLEARRFQEDLPKYMEKNTQILGVSADSVDSHAEFCDSEGLKFPLLADTDGEVSKAYGSWIGYLSMRHTFIIDPEGIIREEYTGVNPAIHSSEVLARLDELQSANS